MTKERVRYLTEKEIMAINFLQIKRFSPKETFGVKEPTALNACVEQPKQEVFGKILYPTVEEKGAILFEMLINKHCFHNGNKRTAAVVLVTFLKLNGIQITVNNNELADMCVAIAEKKGKDRLSTADISRWIQSNSRSIQ